MNPKLSKRVTLYLAKIPEAISGSGGHNQTFHVANILIHGFGLSESEALPFMREYSQRCAPPWSDKELKHKLSSAKKFGRGSCRRL
jgi:hypothetical protein